MAQKLHLEGHSNIIVQAEGDGINVVVGRPHLTLARRHVRARPPRKELDLLNPYNRAVPLIGRETDLDDLQKWLDADAPISIRCLIGRTGSGKTRLGLELCATAEEKGWFAGFLAHDELVRFHAQQNLGSWGWPEPTLIVVDYVAASARALRPWLAELADNPGGDGKPLRLLLLERHADAALGWWPELTTPRGWSEDGLADLFDPLRPIDLPSIVDSEQRRAILAEVMRQASEMAGKARTLRPPPPGEDPDFDRRLAESGLEYEPLYLLMAGLSAVEHGVHSVLALSRTDMAERLADHELERIRKLAKDRGLHGGLLAHLAACITLSGGSAREALNDIIAEERSALGYGETDAVPDLVQALWDALPVTDAQALSPILPDLIGEAAILRTLSDQGFAQGEQVVRRAYTRARMATITTIMRTAQDYALTPEHETLRWLDILLPDIEDFVTMAVIADQLPKQSTNMLERTATIHALLVELARKCIEESPDEVMHSVLALCLQNLSESLSSVGHRPEALMAVEEAVEILRRLAVAHPDAFHLHLAMSINIQANRLGDVGRYKEAVDASREAVGLFRQLEASRADSFHSDLAVCLNTLAISLYRVGRREEALDAAGEALDIRHHLVTSKADTYLPDLARSLCNHATFLSGVGRREEAYEAAKEAVEIRRKLAAARPDAFYPELAVSLHTLANTLCGTRCYGEALTAGEEAVCLYRQLAETRPEVFRPDLARSLLVVADCLEALERTKIALSTYREAIDALSPYFQAEPMAFGLLMGGIVLEYGRLCESMGQNPDANLVGPIAEVFRSLPGQEGTNGEAHDEPREGR